MKKNFFFLLFAFFVLSGSAQSFGLNKKRSYKAEGYILKGADTINGWIAVPITNDELDYYSLSTRITFTDSFEQQKSYKPNNIAGFGFREDEGLGEYISAGEAEGLSKAKFLRKVLEGKISLFQDKLDRNTVEAQGTMGAFDGPTMTRKKDIYKSYFYVRRNNEPLIKIEFKSKTSTVAKKDLKKALNFLPDSFINSDEEVDLPGLIDILSGLNTKS